MLLQVVAELQPREGFHKTLHSFNTRAQIRERSLRYAEIPRCLVPAMLEMSRFARVRYCDLSSMKASARQRSMLIQHVLWWTQGGEAAEADASSGPEGSVLHAQADLPSLLFGIQIGAATVAIHDVDQKDALRVQGP